MRICISRMIQENSTPFNMKFDEKSESPVLLAIKSASRIEKKNYVSDVTLDEIKAEIAEVRGKSS